MAYAISLPVQTHSVMTDGSGGAGGREGRQSSPRKRGALLGTQSAAESNRSPINGVLKHNPSTRRWRECGAGKSSRLATPKSPKAYLAGSLLDIARRATGHTAAQHDWLFSAYTRNTQSSHLFWDPAGPRRKPPTCRLRPWMERGEAVKGSSAWLRP